MFALAKESILRCPGSVPFTKSCETLLYNILTARDEGLEECVVKVGALLTDSDDKRVRDWWMDPLRRDVLPTAKGGPSFSGVTDILRRDLGSFDRVSIWP